MKNKYPYADEPELFEADFNLTQHAIEDPARRLQRELDKRGSDTRIKQVGFDWKHDTRALDSAIGTGRVNEAQLPWNRAATHGMKALSDHELLFAIVGNVASDLLFEAGSFAGLAKWSMAQLETFKGIGRKKAAALASIFEINKRTEEGHRPSYCDPDAVHRLLTPECITLETEHFFVLLLDRKNQLIKKITVGTGTASSCPVHPREVFRDAIFHSASAIIVAHNHPSGDPAPSRADIQITRQLREAAKVVGIDLLDHIIIGAKSRDPRGLGLYSFNEAGLI